MALLCFQKRDRVKLEPKSRIIPFFSPSMHIILKVTPRFKLLTLLTLLTLLA